MILLIEDNPRLSQNITEFLEIEKFEVVAVRDGKTGLEKARSQNFSCIVLDLNLPLISGIEICKTLREEENQTPILMLTAQGDMEDKILGLTIGADDYMTKPFNFNELVARIRVLQRRNSPQKSEIFSLEDVTINFSSHEVSKDGETVVLSPKEFGILEFLIRHKGFVKSRTKILSAVWGEGDEEKLFSSDTVEVHIAYLRKKLGKEIIQTVRGLGYKISI